MYDIKLSEIVASESVPGYLLDPNTAYQGGWLGISALIDAFNPWDFVKAVGRSFKWLAVGRRTREQDSSYMSSDRGVGLEPARAIKFNPVRTSVPFDDNDFTTDPADERLPYTGRQPARYRPLDEDEEDNLLSHAQSVPLSGIDSHSAPPPYSIHSDPSAIDIGTMTRYSSATPDRFPSTPIPRRNSFDQDASENIRPSKNSRTPDEDMRYHGASLSPAPPNPQPPHRGQDDGWDVWGSGSHQELEADGYGSGRLDLGRRGARDGKHF